MSHSAKLFKVPARQPNAQIQDHKSASTEPYFIPKSFLTRTEAYTFSIAFLNTIDPKRSVLKIQSCIKRIQQAIENHITQTSIITTDLENTRAFIPNSEHSTLDKLVTVINASPYEELDSKIQFENVLQRRLESEISITLATSPTKNMMRVIKRVSDEILKVIAHEEKQPSKAFQARIKVFFTAISDAKAYPDCFGSIPNPTLDIVKKILNDNSAAQFPQILLIHLMFGSQVFRHIPIYTAPQRHPSGHLKTILSGKIPETFFGTELKQNDESGYLARACIMDTVFYRSAYYQDRGRGRFKNTTLSQQMGIMLPSQVADTHGLAKQERSWLPDVISHSPDYNSAYVQYHLTNECPYVCGPSGLTSVLLGQMELLANFEQLSLKQIYLAAIMTYIVAGGLHSIHEVLGPATYCLHLIPGYNAPLITKETVNAAPPNYHAFFDLVSRHDPEFTSRINTAWSNYLNYFNKIYMKAHITLNAQSTEQENQANEIPPDEKKSLEDNSFNFKK